MPTKKLAEDICLMHACQPKHLRYLNKLCICCNACTKHNRMLQMWFLCLINHSSIELRINTETYMILHMMILAYMYVWIVC